MKTPTFTPERSAAIKAQLLELSADQTRIAPPATAKKKSWARPAFALAATGALLTTLAGGIHLNAVQAHATETLKDLSQISIHYTDPQPGKGQYLKVLERGSWQTCGFDPARPSECKPGPERRHITYKPADLSKLWSYESQHTDEPERNEVIQARNGEFHGSTRWFSELLEHATSGDALHAYLNDTHIKGASASRDEDNFVRLTDALRTGLVPAKERAAIYSALTKISGVTVTENVETDDGRVGIAIGRTEPLRMGEREEIIVAPQTGQLIGSRTIATVAVLGFGQNEVIGQSVYDYSIVDEAPNRP